MKTRALGIVGLLLIATACVACGGDDEGGGAPAPAPSAPESTGNGEESKPSAASFELEANAEAIVRRTGGGNLAVRVNGGAAVTIEIEGLPAGIGAQLPSIPAGAGEAIIPFSFSADAPAFGEHAIKIRGRNGDVVRELSVKLTVADDPGAFDTTFGSKGLASAAAKSANKSFAVDQQGRTYVTAVDLSGKAFVARYTAAGVLDDTFDGDGRAHVSFDPVESTSLLSVVVGKPGEVFVAGALWGASGKAMPCLAKLDESGKLDGDFGMGGMACISHAELGDTAFILTALHRDDGSLVAAAACGTAAMPDTCVFHLDANGDLDTGFGPGGIVRKKLPNYEVPWEMRFDGEGRIVVGGLTSTAGTQGAFVMRLTNDGEVDPWFGDSGYVAIDTGGVAAILQGIAIGPKNEIYVAGGEATSANLATIFALEPEKGGPLTSFGQAGIKTYPDLGNAYFTALAWDDGKLLLGGTRKVNMKSQACALRVSAVDGAVDQTFASGALTLPVGEQVRTVFAAPSSRAVMLVDVPLSGFAVARTWR